MLNPQGNYGFGGVYIMTPGTLTPDTDLISEVRPFSGDEDNDSARIESLAALIGASALTSRDEVLDAVAAAKARAKSMASYSGRFPLPQKTPPAVLALLRTDDVILISDTLKLLGADHQPHHFTTALAEHGAAVAGDTRPTGKLCFAYDLHFSRETFHADISSGACRRGDGWALSTPTKGDLHGE